MNNKSIITILSICMLLFCNQMMAQTSSVFGNAQWIALESDSTILFPYIHYLKANSPEGQSLKQYASPVLHKSLTLKKKVKSASVSICGLGQYEFFINDKKVGDYFLDPGWTMYNKRLYYNTFDVTDMIKKQKAGSEVNLSVILGGGMYDIPVKGYHKMAGSCGAPKLLLSLNIVYADGTTETVNSEDSWTAEEGKIRYNSIYGGETYDATFFSERVPVVITKPHWDVPLVKQDDKTRIKINKELPATRMSSSSNIYDTGQNCSGKIKISVRGKRGQTVRIRPAEILRNGKIYQHCMNGYTWTYILRGDAEGEEWQPQFSYTGFRYLEVDADEGVEVRKVSALHSTTNTPVAGTFKCSDTLFNNIYTLIDWAIRSNLASITTDCPTREKLGWQEQNHLMAHSMMYRYDMHALMNKIADDMADSQHENGLIPTIAPEYVVFDLGSGFEDTPEWGASFILCPYYTYRWYGDDSAMRKHYDSMKRYIDYLDSRSQNGIINYGLGDWYDIGPNPPGVAQLTSVALSATAMYYYELCTMKQIATILDRGADADTFAKKAEMVKAAFNERFWNESAKCYERGSQTASAMALFMNLVTDDTREHTIKRLVGDINERLKGTDAVITAGDVGYRYVVQALMQNGKSETVWNMNRRDDIPGYAYQLKQGATSLTESWQAYDNASNNHMMLGHLMEWFFQAPGGIRQSDQSVAWSNIIIEPTMVGNLTWAKTSLNTPKGKVTCNWKSNENHSSWTISGIIPKHTEADIVLPDGRTVHVKGGKYKFRSDEEK